MAPEVVLQAKLAPELAHRADVYALGCLAFELFTGTPPFPGKSSMTRMLAHVSTPPPSPSASPSGTPARELDDVVLAALAKDPAQRTPAAPTPSAERWLRRAPQDERDPVRILVADDDHDFRELLWTALSHGVPRCRRRVRG